MLTFYRVMTIFFAWASGHAFGHHHWDMAVLWMFFAVLSMTCVRARANEF